LDTEYDTREEAEAAATTLAFECGDELGAIDVEDREGPGLHD
jgi:hypothetical protein